MPGGGEGWLFWMRCYCEAWTTITIIHVRDVVHAKKIHHNKVGSQPLAVVCGMLKGE